MNATVSRSQADASADNAVGGGILIYHRRTIVPNGMTAVESFRIVEADGDFKLSEGESPNIFRATHRDLWGPNGKTEINPYTFPNTNSSVGPASGLRIYPTTYDMVNFSLGVQYQLGAPDTYDMLLDQFFPSVTAVSGRAFATVSTTLAVTPGGSVGLAPLNPINAGTTLFIAPYTTFFPNGSVSQVTFGGVRCGNTILGRGSVSLSGGSNLQNCVFRDATLTDQPSFYASVVSQGQSGPLLNNTFTNNLVDINISANAVRQNLANYSGNNFSLCKLAGAFGFEISNGTFSMSGPTAVLEVGNSLTVAPSGTLALAQGNKVRMLSGAGLTVQGIFSSAGQSNNTVNFELGNNGGITFQQGATVSANYTRFLPLTSGQRWGTVYINANNFNFTGCEFSYGGGNTPLSAQPMVYVGSNGGTFQSCIFQNAIDRGLMTSINLSFQRSSLNLFDCQFNYNRVGFINSYCDTYYIVRCLFQGNTAVGFYNSSGKISEMGFCKFFSNSYAENYAAIENFDYLGMVSYFTLGYNEIENNYREEIRNNYSGLLYVSVPWAQANSTIRDGSSGYSTYKYVVNNNSAFTVPARGVWWGQAPQAGMFFGSVDDSYPLSSKPVPPAAFRDDDIAASTPTLPNSSIASSAGFSTPSPNADARATRNTWLKQRMTQLRDELRKNPNDEQSARKLTELYGWMSYDRQNETDERAATLPIFTEFESNLKVARSGNRRASSAVQTSGETAMLCNLNWLIEQERYDEARTKLRETESFIDSKENQLTLQLRKTTLHEQARCYASALAALEQAKAISKELYPKEPNRLEVWEGSLKWKMKTDTTATQSDAEEITVKPSVASSETAKPSSAELSQNYPNPFNPATVISYQLPTSSQVSLKVYDMLGREVQTLVNTTQAAGRYAVQFNASGLASGTYFYKLQTSSSDGRSGSFVQTRKLALVK